MDLESCKMLIILVLVVQIWKKDKNSYNSSNNSNRIIINRIMEVNKVLISNRITISLIGVKVKVLTKIITSLI